MEPTRCPNEPRDLQKHTLRDRIEKERKTGKSSKMVWDPFLIKIHKTQIQKHQQILKRKHRIACQRGAKIEPDSVLKLINNQCQKSNFCAW